MGIDGKIECPDCGDMRFPSEPPCECRLIQNGAARELPSLPDPANELCAILIEHRASNGRWPSDMPRAITKAAEWWISIAGTKSKFCENPRLVPKKGGSSGEKYWITPYIERLRNNLRNFLSADEAFQALIVSKASAGIRWRGDGPEFFRRLLDQRELMDRIGPDEYRRKAIYVLKEYFSKRRGRRKA